MDGFDRIRMEKEFDDIRRAEERDRQKEKACRRKR